MIDKRQKSCTKHIHLLTGDSSYERKEFYKVKILFIHPLLLTNTQVLKLCKAFANNSSANIKLSKAQLHKIRQSQGFSSRILGKLVKTGLSLIGNVLKPLAKSVLIPLGLTTAASATNAAIHRKDLDLVA